jgi:hypothetical protein
MNALVASRTAFGIAASGFFSAKKLRPHPQKEALAQGERILFSDKTFLLRPRTQRLWGGSPLE